MDEDCKNPRQLIQLYSQKITNNPSYYVKKH
jgi:hypothetical protein